MTLKMFTKELNHRYIGFQYNVPWIKLLFKNSSFIHGTEIPVWVFTLITLTVLSFPRNPFFCWQISCNTTTILPTLMLFLAVIHFILCCKLFKYLYFRCFQINWTISVVLYHRLNLLLETLIMLGSAMVVIGRPGVNISRSSMSLGNGVSGWEFRFASVWQLTIKHFV